MRDRKTVPSCFLLLTVAVIGFASFTLAGCRHGSTGNKTQQAAAYKTYKLRGKVILINAPAGEVTIAHEAIPGFMDAMTMPYKLKDQAVLRELYPGDQITADVLVSQNDEADVQLDHIVITSQDKADHAPGAPVHLPAPGDAVPDFKMTDQNGRPMHLGQFKGKALLVTFIYTRCPLPNFCPRITKNFAQIEQNLAADAKLYNRSHLLCISFDPEHDSPERLRAYAAGYVPGGKPDYSHWSFAAPAKNALDEIARFFNLGMTPEADSTITHTLSTTLIGPDGKVVKYYPGNEWMPDQVTADIRSLLK